MENIVIYHSSKYRRRWIILGAVMLALGVGGLLFSEGQVFGFNLGISIFYLFGGLYTYYRPFLSIKKNVLWVSAAPFRKIHVHDIQEIKQFLDETTIISKGKETLISTQNMSEEDKEKFLNYVEHLKQNIHKHYIA